MVSWAEFEAAAPDLAIAGRLLFERGGHGSALLATVRSDDPPRIHPISIGVVDGGLFAFIFASAKLTDLERDGRYALHSHVQLEAPDELMVRGRARIVNDETTRGAVITVWSFTPDDTYALVEFTIESALLGRRGPDEWPPRYSRWTAARP